MENFEIKKFWLGEIVTALGILRQHKIVHRDLKPGNIIINLEGHLMICDFGEAKKIKKEISSDEMSKKYMNLMEKYNEDQLLIEEGKYQGTVSDTSFFG